MPQELIGSPVFRGGTVSELFELSPVRPDTPASDDTVLLSDRFQAPQLRDDFYVSVSRSIADLAGYESPVSNFEKVISLLDKELGLGLTEVTKGVYADFLLALSRASRFDGDLHIAKIFGEDTGVHTAHAAVYPTEFFRRAGLLEPGVYNDEIASMLMLVTLSILDHDAGEIFGEMNSLADRVNDSSLFEDSALEAKRFELMLRPAYIGRIQGVNSLFESTHRECWELIRGERGDHPLPVGQIRSKLEAEGLWNMPPGGESYEAMIRGHLFRHNLVENALELASSTHPRIVLCGLAAKILERMQGTRHLIRFSTKDGLSVPQRQFSPQSTYELPSMSLEMTQRLEREMQQTIAISRCTGARMLGNSRYQEQYVGDMNSFAHSKEERAIARAIESGVNTTMLEYYSIATPVIDRRSTAEDRYVAQLAKAMHEADSPERREAHTEDLRLYLCEKQCQLFRELDAMRERYSAKYRRSHLLPIESRGRIVRLFQAAEKVGYRRSPGELLIANDRIPKELQPFMG